MPLGAELRLHERRVRDLMAERGLGAFYVSKEADVRYLTGAETGRLLLTSKGGVLWVKDFYKELYDSIYESRGYPFDVRVQDKDDVKRTLRGLRQKAIGVSSYDAAAVVRKVSRKRTDVVDLVKSARAVKTKCEVELIRRSCGIAKAGMRRAREVIRPGVRELDVVAEVEGELRRRGSEKPPFGDGMLLASGARSCDIHARPTLKGIRRGLVVVDLGATYKGYFSDMTRTFGVGRLSARERDVMDFVRSLKDDAIDGIMPGQLCCDVHKFVDDRIKANGYKFHHLSGHGVGLEIHESPSFSPDSKVKLERNMVFTVEPGIYLPHGFGVRFEDTVLLTGGGCVRLT